MAAVVSGATDKLVNVLAATPGLNAAVAAIAQRENATLAPIAAEQIRRENVAADLVERGAGVNYPVLYVYCEEINNQMREKFRKFSGTLSLAVEVRVSRDRLEAVTRELQLYAEAVTSVLEASRGNWDGGMLYAGGYKVSFGPLKRGGKNFLQAAKVELEVEARDD